MVWFRFRFLVVLHNEHWIACNWCAKLHHTHIKIPALLNGKIISLKQTFTTHLILSNAHITASKHVCGKKDETRQKKMELWRAYFYCVALKSVWCWEDFRICSSPPIEYGYLLCGRMRLLLQLIQLSTWFWYQVDKWQRSTGSLVSYLFPFPQVIVFRDNYEC